MNEFRMRESGAVVTEAAFRAMHNASFPQVIDVATLGEYGADVVLATPQPATTDALGNIVQAWLVTDWPQEQIDAHVASSKIGRWEAIKAERDRRKAGGILVAGKWYHSDDASRIQQLGLLMMGANIPAGLQWKTLDGSFVSMTQALAGQIFTAAAVSDQTVFAKAEWHKAAMEAMSAASNPATYDFSQGWPLVYGE